jgi:hypothetical protein
MGRLSRAPDRRVPASLGLVIGLAVLAPSCRIARPGGSATEPAGVFPIHGTWQTRLRHRRTSGDQDSDLTSTLRADAGDRQRDVVTAHLVARGEFDLDDSGSGTDPFYDVDDARDSDLATRVLQGYADVHALEDLEVLRVGRQPLDETPEALTIDGLRVESRERGESALRLGAYGGKPTHFFESSSRGDLVVGTYAEARPWKGGLARLDWMHLEDDLVLGNERDDLVALSARHAEGRLRVDGGVSLLDGDGRDLRSRASWTDIGQGLLVRLAYYRLLETQGSLVTSLDPFTEALLEYEPFHRIGLDVAKTLGPVTRVELGSELRRLVHAADEGPFNREYERYRLRLARDEILGRPWHAGAGVEHWSGEPSSTTTWSADLGREWDERWSLDLSSTYALWDLDLVSLDERRDVRTYGLELRHELTERVRLELLYEYEDDDLDHYHVLRGGLRWSF